MTHPRLRMLQRLVCTAICAAMCALALPVQSASTQPSMPNARSATGGRLPATVRGTVFDSLAGVPLPHAVVQLVTADGRGTFGRTINADERGQFVFDSVPDGRFTLGFFHPVLDSLGIEPPLRSVQVSGQQSVVVGTGVPAPATFRATVCGPAAGPQGDAVLVGFVRDARSRDGLAGATITVSWIEMTIGAGGMRSHTVRRVTTARANGWYALCQVPRPGTIEVMAHRGADSTDFLEFQVPATGFLRRELSIGRARTMTVAGPAAAPAARSDSASPVARTIRIGDGALSGTVIGTDMGGGAPRPLADAHVGFTNGPQTRTNARGEWTLSGLPSGTRTLEVRAVGYYPGRRAVDVVTDAPPQTIALATFKSVLDTMRVRAGVGGFTSSGFSERSRSGIGTYLTANDLAVRNAFVATDIFRQMSGVFVETPNAGDMDGDRIPMGLTEDMPAVLMRSGAGVRCAPAIVLNGTNLMSLNASDLNNMLTPTDVIGIEIYRQGQSPPQFTPTDGTVCGSIVIWTRQANPSRR